MQYIRIRQDPKAAPTDRQFMVSPDSHERELASVASYRTVDSNPCEPTYSVHDGGVFKSTRTLTIADAWLGPPIAAAESGL